MMRTKATPGNTAAIANNIRHTWSVLSKVSSVPARRRAVVFADAADKWMAIEHLLKQRRTASRHSHDKRRPLAVRRLRTKPGTPLLDQPQLLGHIGIDGNRIERRRGFRVDETC